MKTLYVSLMSNEGDELATYAMEDFAIASEPEEADSDEYCDNQELIARVAALFDSVLALLNERQAVPQQGTMWVKLALGDVLLTADQIEGDIVLPITVQPLTQGD
jgi:hypothetical protein